jgi:hypothetical protein
MRLRYQSPLKKRISIEQTYRDEVRTQATPKWFARLSLLVLVAGLSAICYQIVPDPEKIVALIGFSGLFLWLWHEAREFCYLRFLARYLSIPVESDDWITEIEDQYFTTEHKGMRVSLPFTLFTRVYEKDDYVYLDFSRLGRAYIPSGAFDSVQHRSSFIDTLNSKKEKPNKAPEPTPGSVTPRASEGVPE